MRRFLAVLLGAALGACLVGASVAVVLTAQEPRAEKQGALPQGGSVRALSLAARDRLSLLRARLDDLCANDVRVERLDLELASLGRAALPDVSYAARSLARSHGHAIWVLRESRGKLALLGASEGQAATLTPASLRASKTAPVALSGGAPRVVMACERASSTASTLWIAQAISAQALVQGLVPEDLALAEAASDGGSEVLRIAGAEGSPELSLRVVTRGPFAQVPLELVLGLMGVAGCLGGGLSFALSKRASRELAVLRELERAAERVASGDLSSTIGVRLGGPADQTFATFDRMTHELRETRARLAEAERAAAFQDIARRIAHEIKNPLLPIQVSIETLRKAHARRLAGFDEIFEESTRTVLDEVRRMERIVREFSEFARLPKPKPGALSVAALSEEVVSLYRPEDVEVSLEAEQGLPSVRADREQITQVLVNLLQNAFDAARENGAPKVAVRVGRVPDGVALHVDDNGPGVSEGERARIFEPYVTSKAQGTGLGLAIVKRIASDHGANIEVTASPLGGARFSLVLRHDADATAPGRAPCAADGARRGPQPPASRNP